MEGEFIAATFIWRIGGGGTRQGDYTEVIDAISVSCGTLNCGLLTILKVAVDDVIHMSSINFMGKS